MNPSSCSNSSMPKRQSNFELLRILAMLSIIAHHYVVNSNVMGCIIDNRTSIRSCFLLLFGAWGKTAINVFVLISCYFMCKSSISLAKYLKLLGEYIFYAISIFFFYVIRGDMDFSWLTLLKRCNPFYTVSNSYVPAFFLFYLFIPFLNVLIRNLAKSQHERIIVLSLFVYSGLGSMPFIGFSFNYISWFVVLYFIGSYIRLYPQRKMFNIRFVKLKLLLYVLIACTSVIYRFESYSDNAYYWVSDSNRILALLVAVYVFLLFEQLHLNPCAWVNFVAKTTLGILLIHADSSIMRQLVWNTIFPNDVYFFISPYIHAIAKVIIVFVVCSSLDAIRIISVEKVWMWVVGKLVRWINSIDKCNCHVKIDSD